MMYHGKEHWIEELPKGKKYFHIYPKTAKLLDESWDFHINPCNNCRFIQMIKDTQLFQCLGHRMSASLPVFTPQQMRNNQQFQAKKSTPILSQYQQFQGFSCSCGKSIQPHQVYTFQHGREHWLKNLQDGGKYFHIYPNNLNLVDKSWDFYEIPCNNCLFVASFDEIKCFRCYGHKVDCSNHLYNL